MYGLWDQEGRGLETGIENYNLSFNRRIRQFEWTVTLRQFEKIKRSSTTLIYPVETLAGSRIISSVNVTSEGADDRIDHLRDRSWVYLRKFGC